MTEASENTPQKDPKSEKENDLRKRMTPEELFVYLDQSIKEYGLVNPITPKQAKKQKYQALIELSVPKNKKEIDNLRIDYVRIRKYRGPEAVRLVKKGNEIALFIADY